MSSFSSVCGGCSTISISLDDAGGGTSGGARCFVRGITTVSATRRQIARCEELLSMADQSRERAKSSLKARVDKEPRRRGGPGLSRERLWQRSYLASPLSKLTDSYFAGEATYPWVRNFIQRLRKAHKLAAHPICSRSSAQEKVSASVSMPVDTISQVCGHVIITVPM
jgi:hypothetical protein